MFGSPTFAEHEESEQNQESAGQHPSYSHRNRGVKEARKQTEGGIGVREREEGREEGTIETERLEQEL